MLLLRHFLGRKFAAGPEFGNGKRGHYKRALLTGGFSRISKTSYLTLFPKPMHFLCADHHGRLEFF